MKPESFPEVKLGDKDPSSGKNSNRYIPSKNARITIFHILWLALALGSSAICYVDAMNRGFSIILRILETTAGGIVGYFVGQFAILLLVTSVVIPRLKQGSVWDYEVNCYMAQMFGKKWDDLGRKQEQPNEEKDQ